jgi:hypothetical protein
MKPRLNFSLATAIKLMFVASLLMWLNTRKIFTYSGNVQLTAVTAQLRNKSEPVESLVINNDVYSVTGIGWPEAWRSSGAQAEILPRGLLSNLLIALLVLMYSAIFFESRHPKKWLGFGLSVCIGISAFLVYCLMATKPEVLNVSYHQRFNPWWENWRNGAGSFIVSWLLITIYLLNEDYIKTKLKPRLLKLLRRTPKESNSP